MMLLVVVYHCAALWMPAGWFNQAPKTDSCVLGLLAEWLNYIHIYFYFGYCFRKYGSDLLNKMSVCMAVVINIGLFYCIRLINNNQVGIRSVCVKTTSSACRVSRGWFVVC